MTDDALTQMILRDLIEASDLYLRRGCSLLVLRIRWQRTATQLRLPSPDDAELAGSFADVLETIERDCDPRRQFAEACRAIDRMRDVMAPRLTDRAAS